MLRGCLRRRTNGNFRSDRQNHDSASLLAYIPLLMAAGFKCQSGGEYVWSRVKLWTTSPSLIVQDCVRLCLQMKVGVAHISGIAKCELLFYELFPRALPDALNPMFSFST